ncbi:hypothetical protein EI42_00768 [Thermosporothrix hazakensis]|jgi:hypothetical protein|uniref:Uncharacterized protein n=1 Tax=Thermosporothrix hazakensis TaxID=644383 RepID=A0A326UIG2_THEHA|nr:hypothetical protein [Thermosporothrix hazakensis]PZW36590.1 hypothetical protein EI42_00768 [Thermosporothrix hazakensis]GCE47241.1 hypothetical protein KTH_21100 [Thermosporothrix hazakensis]
MELAVINPIIEAGGQIAAIIICLFALILIILALALNIGFFYAFTWVRQKTELIKVLRPHVESINKTTMLVKQGSEPDESQNAIVRTVAKVPAGVDKVDQKVTQATGKVAQGAIEVRARIEQGKAIVKTFFKPPRKQNLEERINKEGLQFTSPGYRTLMKEKAPVSTAESPSGEGYEQTITAKQLKDVPSR